MSDRLLSLMQLANRWGWSRHRVYRLVTSKRIPHLRIGERRDVFFREAEITAWLESQTVRPKARAAAPLGPTVEEECADFGITPDEAFL